MAITHFMLQSNPFLFQKQFNSPTLVSHPIRWSSAHLTRNYFSCNIIRASPKMGINCIPMNHKSNAEKGINRNLKKVDVNHERVLIWRSIENVLRTLKKPVITGVVVVLGLLLLCDYGCQHALAASGGSMGGSDFSSDSYSSSSSSDDDSYSSSYHNYGDSYISNNGKNKTSSSSELVEPHLSHVVVTVIINVVIFLLYLSLSATKKDTSVLKLQVGLVGSARSLQRDLNVIAKTTDTSKPNGFKYILQETIAALLRNPDYCISGYSSLDVENGVREAEKRIKELSAEERSKFDGLTLINFNNIRKQSATSEESDGFPNEYIVITIIVAAKGVHELPAIKSVPKLKEALQKLSSIPSSKIMAAEVLWTSQKENDSLTKGQVREDYPLLHPL